MAQNTSTIQQHSETDVERFFERYAAALLARDAKAVARMYAVPSLILFPGSSELVTDERRTEEFFDSGWAQYEGVTEANPRIEILGRAPASVWADVTWYYGGAARERFVYQLVPGADAYQIAVLTPMDLPAGGQAD
jgi:hypothetical protein